MSVPENAPADAVTFYEAVTRVLFGYDVFISYPRLDGAELAGALYTSLRQRRFVAFLDRHEGLYGADLERVLRRRLARSQALVVLATPGAFASPHIAFEVQAFTEAHARQPRPIIPIGTRELRAACPWPSLARVVWIEDREEVEANPKTLAALVDKIEQALRATRRELLLRNALVLASMIFLAVAVAAVYQGVQASRQRDRAVALRLASRSELLREEQANQLNTAALLAAEAVLRNRGDNFESGRAMTRALELMAEQPTTIGLPSPARLVRFTDDGSAIAAVLANGSLRVHRVDGTLLWEKDGAGTAAAIVTASTTTVSVRDDDGALRSFSSTSAAPDLVSPGLAGARVSSDGRFALVSAPDPRSSMLVALDSQKPPRPFTGLDLSDVTTFVASPEVVDGEQHHQFVAVGTQRARTAFLVDLVTGVLTKLEPGNVIDNAAFSADGKALALAGRNFEVSIYDTTGRVTGRVRHQHFVRSLALSADGRYVLTGSVDRTSRLVATGSGLEELRVPHDGIVDSAAFNPSGSAFVTASGNALRIFSTRSPRDWTRVDKDLRTVSALLTVPSADRGAPAVPLLVPMAAIANDRVAVADVRQQRVTLHDATNGLELQHWEVRQRPTALALDRAGTTVAVATADGRTWLLDKNGAATLADVSSLGQVTTLALAREWLIAGGDSGALAISRQDKDKVCRTPGTAHARSVAVDEGGNRAFVGTDSSLDVLELTSCAKAFSIPHVEPIMAVALSPTAAWLATGTSDTPLVRVFALTRIGATERFSLPRQGAIRTMAFDAAEGYLAVGAEDRTTRLYSTRDGSESGRTNFTISPWSVAFSADGTKLRSLTGEDDLSKTTLAIAARTLDTGGVLTEMCRRNPLSALSPGAWNTFMPELAYRRTCDAVPTARP